MNYHSKTTSEKELSKKNLYSWSYMIFRVENIFFYTFSLFLCLQKKNDVLRDSDGDFSKPVFNEPKDGNKA